MSSQTDVLIGSAQFAVASMNAFGFDFDWDSGNLGHIARHGVSRDEAEEVVLGDPLEMELQTEEGSGEEIRLLQVGQTVQGRILQLVTTWRNAKIRVISAWDAPKSLKGMYLAHWSERYGSSEDSPL